MQDSRSDVVLEILGTKPRVNDSHLTQPPNQKRHHGSSFLYFTGMQVRHSVENNEKHMTKYDSVDLNSVNLLNYRHRC